MTSTRVVDLTTGVVIVYSLPPEDAVKMAYQNFTLGDFNWAQKNERVPAPKKSLLHIVCGDYLAQF